MKKAIITGLAVLAACAALIGAYILGRTQTPTATNQDVINLNDVQGFSANGDELHIYTADGNEYLIVR